MCGLKFHIQKYKFYVQLYFAGSALGFFVVACGFFAYAMVFLYSEEYQGTVVESISEKDKESGSYRYRAKVEYDDNTGVKRTFISRVASNPQMYFVGDQVVVLYNPNLGWTTIYNFTEMWLFPLCFLIAGLVNATLFLCICYICRKDVRRLKNDGKSDEDLNGNTGAKQ